MCIYYKNKRTVVPQHDFFSQFIIFFECNNFIYHHYYNPTYNNNHRK